MNEFLKERWPALVVAVVTVVFIAQNRDKTNISLLWLDVTWPLWLTLTIVTLLGIVIGYVVKGRRDKAKQG